MIDLLEEVKEKEAGDDQVWLGRTVGGLPVDGGAAVSSFVGRRYSQRAFSSFGSIVQGASPVNR
jgi:hypothetical protein